MDRSPYKTSPTGEILPLGPTVNAPGKINLSLHVEGRRADGYHQLSGLVAFSKVADQLQFEICRQDKRSTDEKSRWSLEISGPFAGQLSAPCAIASENLVSKAARLYGLQCVEGLSGVIRLKKNLPIAAGIGGGSSDAAATLVALQKTNSSPLSKEQISEIALELGADVPMCLTPTAQMIGGIGEIRQVVEPFAPLPAVLVNPGVNVATKNVFADLEAAQLPSQYHSAALPTPDLSTKAAIIEYLRSQRNDLQAPAMRIAPVIGNVLELIGKDKNCRLARMSGSGATCFGLYDSLNIAEHAVQKIHTAHPDWWVVATVLK